jgi:hypothetical protein
MVRFVNAFILLGLLALFAQGCKATIRVYDAQSCSTDPGDDPLLVCSPAYNLVCANTYAVPILNPTEAMKFPRGERPVYLCRIACNVQNPETYSSTDCTMLSETGQVDICCPEPVIYGKQYQGYKGVCVPRGKCDVLRTPVPDAGAPLDSAPAPSDDGGRQIPGAGETVDAASNPPDAAASGG